MPGRDDASPVRSEIERGQVFTMRTRHPADLGGARDVDDHHVALTHDSQTLPGAVEAQPVTAMAHENAAHLGPRPRSRAGAPESQGAIAIDAERGEQLAGGAEREIQHGLS